MDYKAEVLVNRKIVHSTIYVDYSHPNQVVKKIIKLIKGKYAYFTVFVMNKYGEIWQYGVEKTSNGYNSLLLSNDMNSKREVMMVFSGNIAIAELVGGAR